MKNIFAYISLILIVVSSFLYFKMNNIKNKLNEVKQNNNLLEISNDSLKKVWNDNINQWQYERESLLASNETLTEYLKNNEKDLYELKKNYKSVVGIISEFEFHIDTVVKNDTIKVHELDTTIRIANIKNKYYKANIKSYRDSTKLSLYDIYNKQDFSIDKNGKLIIANSNPYINQIEGKAFYVTQPKQKTKNWKYYIGIAAGIAGSYYLIK